MQRTIWNRFTRLQVLVIALASVPLMAIGGVVLARMANLISSETMIDIALGAGEEPGMLIFGAMFFASPVQWITGRSQVRVRKYLGIVFFLLAVNNFAMFIVERGLGDALSEPFLVAGVIAVVLATPLFLTSSRWSQRTMGLRNWRQLHKLTYLVAAALLGHSLLAPEFGPGELLIIAGFVARIPPVRRLLTKRDTPRVIGEMAGPQAEAQPA